MSFSDWIAVFGAILTTASLYVAIETWRISRKEASELRIQESKEKADIRIHDAEKQNVLNSVGTLAEVMKEFRLTQKEQEKAILTVQVAVAELRVNMDFLKETFSRGEFIQTPDGWVYNANKVNKQK